MLEIIISLLMMLGVDLSGKDGEVGITVIDQTSGISYGLGSSNGMGNRPLETDEVYFLIQDENGEYHLVHK